MIIQKCDICKNTTTKLNTIVLYKRSIDYCDRCEERIDKIKQQFEREVEYRNICFDSALREEEKKIISKLKETNNKGIVIKE